MTKLFEIEHPYYCAEHNYRVSGTKSHEVIFEYDDWLLFTESGWFNSDQDLNLLFRFDWKDGELYLYWILQRKGDFNCCIIHDMKIENEPEVREFLQKRFNHLKNLWEPLV
jgi:hypothetical protein